MTWPDVVTGTDLVAIVARLAEFPDRHRAFTVTPDDAARGYGLAVEVLDAAIAAGLALTRGAEALVDPYDVHYLATRLRAAGPEGPPRPAPAAFRVDYRLPRRSARAGTYVLTVPGAGRVDVAVEAGTSLLWSGRVATRRDLPPVTDPAVIDVLDEVGRLEHRFLPPALRGDAEFVRRHGFGDCGTVAGLLCAALAAAGASGRAAYGLQLADPLSHTHTWVEIDLEGGRVPVDPLMSGLLHRYAGVPRLSGGTDPVAPMLCRLADAPKTLASIDGRPVAVSLPTTAYEGDERS